MASGPEGRRNFLVLLMAAVAAVFAGRLLRAPAPGDRADARAGAAPEARGWREARHWREI